MKETVLSGELRKRERRWKASKLFYSVVTAVIMSALCVVAVFATSNASNDATAAVNRMTTLIFSLLSAAGLAILAFGVFQLGMSFKNHDPSQRAQGVMAILGGVVIAMARPIAEYIAGRSVGSMITFMM